MTVCRGFFVARQQTVRRLGPLSPRVLECHGCRVHRAHYRDAFYTIAEKP
jgi:hypothetical protein